MRLCVGIDHLEIHRITKAMENPRFLSRYFGARELEYFKRRRFSPATVAVSFCAKEAFAKALGTGIRGFALREVELLREDSGRPYLVFSGKAAGLIEKSGLRFEVSVSHDRRYALAQVIGYVEGEHHAGSNRR